MKKFILVAALLFGAATAAVAQAPVYEVTVTSTTVTADVNAALALAKAARLRAGTVATVKQVVVPPGFHAHTRTDGTVIIHSDALMNDPAAHAGVPYPWHKTATAGQTVTVNSTPVVQTAPATTLTTYTTSSFSQQSCPNGVCPTATSNRGRNGGGWYLGKNLGW